MKLKHMASLSFACIIASISNVAVGADISAKESTEKGEYQEKKNKTKAEKKGVMKEEMKSKAKKAEEKKIGVEKLPDPCKIRKLPECE